MRSGFGLAQARNPNRLLALKHARMRKQVEAQLGWSVDTELERLRTENAILRRMTTPEHNTRVMAATA